MIRASSVVVTGSLVVLGAVLAGCGGSAPPPKVEEAPKEEEAPVSRAPLPQMQQELGSIDERAVEQTFQQLQTKVEACHDKGRRQIEYLAGDVKVFLRIDQSGKVRWGYFEETTLGDRATETCILDVYQAATWPKPQGGEAEVRYGFGWGPGGEREPATWGPEKVMGALSEQKTTKKAVAKCRANAKGEVRITAYVVASDDETAFDDEADEPALRAKPGTKSSHAKHGKKKGAAAKKGKEEEGGKFQAIGVGASTREAADRADCIVDALKDLALPSPGSYVAKVSYTLP